MSMFGPKEGSWWLRSKKDPRWNCDGRGYLLFSAGYPPEIARRIEINADNPCKVETIILNIVGRYFLNFELIPLTISKNFFLAFIPTFTGRHITVTKTTRIIFLVVDFDGRRTNRV